jgi:hypothetical protein
MKATAHWLELKGHTPKSPSMHFDEVFSDQVIRRGKIEESSIIQQFFRRTGQPLLQDWLIAMARSLVMKLPVKLMMTMGLGTIFKPRTSGWSRAQKAMEEYIEEQETGVRSALKLNGQHTPVADWSEKSAEDYIDHGTQPYRSHYPGSPQSSETGAAKAGNGQAQSGNTT